MKIKKSKDLAIWKLDTFDFGGMSKSNRSTVGQNQAAQYLNYINLWKWTNLWAEYWLNCSPKYPSQTF